MPTNTNTLMSQLRSRGTVIAKHDLELILAEAVLRAGEASPSIEYGSLAGVDNGGVPRSGLLTTPADLDDYTPFLGPSDESSSLITASQAAGTLTVGAGGAGVYRVSFSMVVSPAAGAGDLTLILQVDGSSNSSIEYLVSDLDAAGAGQQLVRAPTAEAVFPIAEGEVISLGASASADALTVSLLLLSLNITRLGE